QQRRDFFFERLVRDRAKERMLSLAAGVVEERCRQRAGPGRIERIDELFVFLRFQERPEVDALRGEEFTCGAGLARKVPGDEHERDALVLVRTVKTHEI